VPLLEHAAIREALRRVPGWELAGVEIRKRFKLPSFPAALAFAMEVAFVAERLDHHPDFLIQYDQVTLSVTTHSAGGLTEKDFALAEAVERIRSR
jgi:4a-hydroxytetrahydrobiopterin dehydratase